MKQEFNEVNKKIKDFFKGDLISLVVFGSSCRRKEFKIVSDIDYIIVLKKSVKDQDILSRKLKRHLKKYFALLAFNIYDEETFQNIIDNQDWLVLSIKLGYKVIFDKNNFFTDKLEKRFKQIKAKRIAPLGWWVTKSLPDRKVVNHLFELSDEYLIGSKKLFKEKLFGLANLLLLDSLHSFLSALLLRRNIFITKGEISQCFIKNYGVDFGPLSKDLLEMEQICGQIGRISFNFNKNGQISYIDDKKFLSGFYSRKYKMFMEIKKKYPQNGHKDIKKSN